jgi:hypothetical protein
MAEEFTAKLIDQFSERTSPEHKAFARIFKPDVSLFLSDGD